MRNEDKVIRMTRYCPVCGSGKGDWIDAQRSLICCWGCGTSYVREQSTANAPDYASRSLYARPQALGSGDSPEECQRHWETAKLIDRLCERQKWLILDVGCAQGGLMRALNEEGFAVHGIDPSAECVRAASAYGLCNVVQLPLPEVKGAVPTYDLAILSHVVEHLWEPAPALCSLLPYASRLYVEVPDAARYSESVVEPWRHFSAEHVNHLTMASLARLAERAGWRVMQAGQKEIPHAGLGREGAIWVLLEPGRSPLEVMQGYATRSREVSERLEARVFERLGGATEIAVWGAGALWRNISDWGLWKKVSVRLLVDSNPQLCPGAVLPAKLLDLPPMPVLVASFMWRDSILADMRRMGIAERAVTL